MRERKPLQIAPITLSAEVAYPGAPVTVETEITGDRVGFVYSFIGRFLPEDDVLIIEDQDFLFADEDAIVGGVTYPQWPEGTFTVGYDWEPIVYAISDGATSIRTLFAPETYGEQPTYTVEGIYSFRRWQPGPLRPPLLPRRRTVAGLWLYRRRQQRRRRPARSRRSPATSSPCSNRATTWPKTPRTSSTARESGTLTFGDEPFYIEETPAPSGNYVVGVIAEDLDGNQVESYEASLCRERRRRHRRRLCATWSTKTSALRCSSGDLGAGR